METRREIAYDKSIPFLQYLLALPSMQFHWDPELLKVHGTFEGEKWTFRLPLLCSVPNVGQSLPDYVDKLTNVPCSYLLILMQAGHSAMAYFEEGKMLHHKVIKKYMVRGNGRAQVSYLQSRGKSKAGSRIRLANTVTFFEDINEKLREWGRTDEANRIFYSCPIALRPHWFQSRITPPFDKDDPRLQTVPMDVSRPDLEELIKVNKFLLRGAWQGPATLVDAFFHAKAEEE